MLKIPTVGSYWDEQKRWFNSNTPVMIKPLNMAATKPRPVFSRSNSCASEGIDLGDAAYRARLADTQRQSGPIAAPAEGAD